jgi:hypothetical protein
MLFTNLEFDQEQRNRMRALSAPDEVYFGDPEQTPEADREAFLKAEIAFGWCPPEWLAEAGALDAVRFGRDRGIRPSGLGSAIPAAGVH